MARRICNACWICPPPLGAQLGQLPFQGLGGRAVEINQEGPDGGRGPVAVPTELQQGFPDRDHGGGQIQQALQILRATQLHAPLLQPQQKVDLIPLDLGQA